MFIQTEDTPNAETMKFLPGRIIVNTGTRDFRARLECTAAPLARRLFDVQGVAGVMYGFDFVSVTKSPDEDWSYLKPLVLSSMMDHFLAGLPVLEEGEGEAEDASGEDSSIIKEIKHLLDTRVRPSVAQDGGDILFDRFDAETGVLFLHLRGACSGCPSSSMTLKSGIENMMRYYIPEVLEVRAASDH
jgi:Fe-S cluster biogenesis protein NfuA